MSSHSVLYLGRWQLRYQALKEKPILVKILIILFKFKIHKQELQLTKGVLLLLVFCWERECSYIPSWFGTRYVGQADLEILVLLPLPPSHVVRYKCVQVNSDFISNPKTSFHTSFIALTFLVHSSLILVKCLRWPLVTFPNAHDLLLLNKLQLSK